MTWYEGMVMAPLLVAILFLGIYPKPVLERIEPAVDRLIAHVESHTDYRQPAVAREGPTAVQAEPTGNR
jgi:NADH-quinone oxidoreductase subunit M